MVWIKITSFTFLIFLWDMNSNDRKIKKKNLCLKLQVTKQLVRAVDENMNHVHNSVIQDVGAKFIQVLMGVV